MSDLVPRVDGLSAARDLLTDLRALGHTPAPSTCVSGTLTRVGLADSYMTIETPLGLVYLAWNERGLSVARRAATHGDFEVEAYALLGRRVFLETEPPQRMEQALRAWLAGDRRAPLTFDLRGQTPFMQAALLKAREIPYGEVRPYSWVAREIGRPGAVRAVGTAMARNPVPVFIPCHRVVRADGHLGAYGMGGPESKRAILQAEGLNVKRVEALATAGVRYVSSASGDSYCYPSCHFAQSIAPEQLITFASEEEAVAAGYIPCDICRPPLAALAG
jgi:O-6-methylguanine DNA methyltransferase